MIFMAGVGSSSTFHLVFLFHLFMGRRWFLLISRDGFNGFNDVFFRSMCVLILLPFDSMLLDPFLFPVLCGRLSIVRRCQRRRCKCMGSSSSHPVGRTHRWRWRRQGVSEREHPFVIIARTAPTGQGHNDGSPWYHCIFRAFGINLLLVT
jgi:hypothetical protein